jgi:NAD(P)H-hydrate epimerase
MTRDEVRRIDQYATAALGIPGVILMENAGRNCADAIEQLLDGAVAGRSVAVVAGGGNNGGDGFVVARRLGMRGAEVAVFLVAPPGGIGGDAAVNLRILESLGADVRQFDQKLQSLSAELRRFDVVVDAIGGTGIKGQLRPELATAVQQVNLAGRTVVAIDIPTGLDCDSGEPLGQAIRADLTVTMVARKRGFDNLNSQQYTGDVVVADIGVPHEVIERLSRESR